MLQKAQIVIDQLTADWQKLKNKKGASQKQIDFKMHQINTLIELYNVADGEYRNQISNVQSELIAMFAFKLLKDNKYDASVITDLLNHSSGESVYHKAVADIKTRLWSVSDIPTVADKVFTSNLPDKRVLDFLKWQEEKELELEKDARAMVLDIIEIINSSIKNGVEKIN